MDKLTEMTLYVGHGSRDQEGNQEFLAFIDELTGQGDAVASEACFLELASPTIPEGIDACVARGATRIVVVPVILLAASHVKLEIPAFIDAGREKYPHVKFVYGRNVGLHKKMIELLTSRFVETVSHSDLTEETQQTAIVLMGRGSSDPDANGDLYKIARALWERTGVHTVEVCFTGITFPRLPDGVQRAIALGAKQLVVVPYFLFTGVLMRRMTDLLETLQQECPDVRMTMAPYFGMHPTLMEIVSDRRQEADNGQPHMNCDLCQYRKQVQQNHDHSHDHSHDHQHTHEVAAQAPVQV